MQRRDLMRALPAFAVPGTLLVPNTALSMPQPEVTRERLGEAFDVDSGALIYEERHRETVVNGAVVADRIDYFDASGKRFAEKRVQFDNGPLLPDFELTNFRTGHGEALQRTSNGIEVRFRERQSAPVRRARVAPPRGALADAGFDRFIETYWDTLVNGDQPERDFLIPSRLDFYGFRIRRDAADARTVTFALEVGSAWLRLVAPTIRVTYERGSKRLRRYDGLSNLRDESGSNYNVRVDFEEA